MMPFKHNVSLAKSTVFVVMFPTGIVRRRFTQGFKGDEFNVYRRYEVSTSPYLFFLIMVISKYLVLLKPKLS
jgi:anthranilate synthase component 1